MKLLQGQKAFNSLLQNERRFLLPYRVKEICFGWVLSNFVWKRAVWDTKRSYGVQTNFHKLFLFVKLSSVVRHGAAIFSLSIQSPIHDRVSCIQESCSCFCCQLEYFFKYKDISWTFFFSQFIDSFWYHAITGNRDKFAFWLCACSAICPKFLFLKKT